MASKYEVLNPWQEKHKMCVDNTVVNAMIDKIQIWDKI